MTGPTPPDLPDELLDDIREHRGRFRWLGIGLVIAGILAVLFPLVASIAAKVMIGWFLLVVGGVTLWHAFQARSWQDAALSGLIGVLHLAAGVYLAFFPLTGLVGLTVLLAILFGIQGAIEIAMARRQKSPGRWMMISGIASLVLAVLLIVGLPGSALWALGLMLGINFLSSGIAFLALARLE